MPPLPDVPPAALSRDRYDNARLDVTLPVPRQFRASLIDGSLVLENDDGLMEVGFSQAIVSTQSTAKAYRDFIESLDVTEARLEVSSNARIETGIGAGLERTWSVPGTPIRLQVVVVPVCNQNGAVVFKRLWTAPREGELLDWVIEAARRLRGNTRPVCAELF